MNRRHANRHAGVLEPIGSRVWVVDRIGFAVFVCYVVLAFTTAIPNHFTLPKLLGLHAYVVFAAVRWWRHAQQGATRPPRGSLLAVAGLLVLWSAAAVANAAHVQTALYGIYARYNGFFTLLAGLSLCVSTATQRLPDREIAARLAWLCIAVTASCFYAVLQAVGLDVIAWPQRRPGSTLGNPVVLGSLVAMVVPFMAAITSQAEDRRCRAAWGASTVLALLALTATLARGPWVAALLGMSVWVPVWLKDKRRVVRARAGAAAGVLLVSATIVVFYEPVRTPLVSRLRSVGSLEADYSASIRLMSVRAAIAMLRDHPVTGIGFENFPLLYPAYRLAQSEAFAPDVIPTMVHSQPLQVALSIGLPGLVAFAALAWSIASRTWRRWRRETDPRQRLIGAAFLAAFVAHAVDSLVGWPDVAVSALAWVVAGLSASWASRSSEDDDGLHVCRRPGSTAITRPIVLLAAAACVMGGALGRDTWMRIRADRLILLARQTNPARAWPAVQQACEEAVRISPDKAWASDAAAALHVRRVVVASDRRAYDRGVALTREARRANPFDSYVQLRRVELETAALSRELVSEADADARQALAKAKSLDPNNGTVYEWEARLALADGRAGEADWAINKALSLRPGWAAYRALLAEIDSRREGRPEQHRP